MKNSSECSPYARLYAFIKLKQSLSENSSRKFDEGDWSDATIDETFIEKRMPPAHNDDGQEAICLSQEFEANAFVEECLTSQFAGLSRKTKKES